MARGKQVAKEFRRSLRVGAVAAAVGCGEKHAGTLIDRGDIKGFRVGWQRRVWPEDLADYLRSRGRRVDRVPDVPAEDGRLRLALARTRRLAAGESPEAVYPDGNSVAQRTDLELVAVHYWREKGVA